jgi:hypothetical protein
MFAMRPLMSRRLFVSSSSTSLSSSTPIRGRLFFSSFSFSSPSLSVRKNNGWTLDVLPQNNRAAYLRLHPQPPRLPLPPLDQTCQRYLSFVLPLLESSEAIQTTKVRERRRKRRERRTSLHFSLLLLLLFPSLMYFLLWFFFSFPRSSFSSSLFPILNSSTLLKKNVEEFRAPGGVGQQLHELLKKLDQSVSATSILFRFPPAFLF